MKELNNITEEEVREICRLAGEPYLDFMTNSHGRWTSGVMVQINTTSTLYGCKHDGYITVHENGMVSLWRNTGEWNGHGYEQINGLLITDYLRKQGYVFDDSNDPIIALQTATKIIERLIASKPVKNLDEHLANFKSFYHE